MKRKFLILSVLALCFSLFAAETIAYFTADSKAHNVITTGSVQIAVQEWADDERTKPFEDVTGVMPETTVTKIVEIKNTGVSDAWVRVMVDKKIELACNTADWTEKDGYYYYNKVLKPGEVTAPVCTAVSFHADMSNAYQNATATIDIFAQATQSANNGNTAMDAQGWPKV